MTAIPAAIREDPMGSIRDAIRRLQEATALTREMNASRRTTAAMLTAWEHGDPVRNARQPALAAHAQAAPGLHQPASDAGPRAEPGSCRAVTADTEAGR